MLDSVRRIVSGRKARYTQDGFDLDLCRLTDRIIIMGFPAVGVASLYRNKRSDVLRFLEPYAPRYRIFNLCPLYENSYDAEAFQQGVLDDAQVRAQEEEALGGPVQRYPWPDHHPPPLSLMRIMTEGVKKWYLQDERNVVVIHCKAGKGRSGTFAISLLLALPGLPSAPTIAPTDETRDEEEEYRALDPKGVLGRTDEEIKDLSLEDKLKYLLRLHTVRRMSPGAKKYGVSIASQRRFLGYWVRLLEGKDPRQLPDAHRPRRIVLEYVKVFGPGLSGMGKVLSGGNEKMSIQVWRYKDSIAANLREKELALTTGDPATRPAISNDDWDDRGEMLVHVGGLVESSEAAVGTLESSTGEDAVKRAPTPPTATDQTSHPLSSSVTSSASVSTGSLPSAVQASPASTPTSSRSPTPLPPPSESAAQHPPRTATESARSRTLVPRTAYLSPPSPLVGSEVADGERRRNEKEAKQGVKEEGGIVLDADREVMLKFLVGKTGDRHGKLPVMASLALTWFIPSFEAAAPSSSSSTSATPRSTLVIEGKDLDFRKPFAGIDRIEVGWRWIG
ncbi:hypothetical protein JCM10908_003357 [Rhodotorula pacifica]|uniref:putative phosphatidylinositol-3,4,5-trisphosphate 3-phosphatase n=1 Tax=Rhodotorula pacifica TaxID=1495444 RepID=UPI0031750D4E